MRVKLTTNKASENPEIIDDIAQISVTIDGKVFSIRADAMGLVITGKNTGGLIIIPSSSANLIHVTSQG